jgi:hypothetical protein
MLFAMGGFIGAHKSGIARAGTYAGLFAALSCSVIHTMSSILIMFLFLNTKQYHAFWNNHFGFEGDPGSAYYLLVVSLLYGGFLGTLGGLLGAFSFRKGTGGKERI